MKIVSKVIFLLSLISFQVRAQDKRPWVYFDLGDTVINTKDMKHLKYFKGSKEYIDNLRRDGFNIGLITNIPETFGMDYDEKLQTLKKVIHDGWDDEVPFDWAAFDKIILPLKNNEMKPAPTLFLKAMKIAESCPSAYIGESPKEIEAARNVGMAAKLFIESDEELYIPANKVDEYLAKNYKAEYDKDCLRL